jgi:hypothetical protein
LFGHYEIIAIVETAQVLATLKTLGVNDALFVVLATLHLTEPHPRIAPNDYIDVMVDRAGACVLRFGSVGEVLELEASG